MMSAELSDFVTPPPCPHRDESGVEVLLSHTEQVRNLWMQGDPSQRQICPHCNKELKNTHSLTVHISRYHREGSQGISEVACPVCKRVYRWVGVKECILDRPE